MQSFDRKYRLSVIEQVVETFNESTSFPLSSQEGWSFPYSPPSPFNPIEPATRTVTTQNTITSAGDGVLIDDLHIVASIKSNTSVGDTGNTTIQIYNASEETRNKLEKQNAYVILEAGYGDLLGTIFTGNIIDFDTEKSGTDVVLTLTCSTAQIPIKTSRVSISYSPSYQGGTYGDIIRDIVQQMKAGGIAEGIVVTSRATVANLPVPDNTPIKGGFSFRGYTSQLLDKICEQFDYTWYITLNELYIHPKFYNSFGVKYTLEEFQVKSIRPAQDTTNISPTLKRPTGLKVITLLDYRMKTGESIEIAFGQYAGTYKILTVEFDLSYDDGGPWDNVLTLEAV